MAGDAAPGAGSRDPRGRFSLAAFVAIVVLALVLYRGTATSMVEIWYRSETFNHGFLVLPISLWLIWQRRAVLAALPIQPDLRVLPLLALAAALWLLGDLAGVNAATQFALVSLLVLLVPAIFGMPIARAILFPLGFLFFMVPVGEFAMPLLMDWTAEFTVVALRLSGIPVYQEGLQFVIPSGRWSVVEACSGVRYLIASTCVGMLFAYLNYVSPRRRIAFVAVSIVVPVIANWLRAYMIVMIGHLSNGRLAAGVDHLIYGWLFFGVVIMTMFMIGARWAERDPLQAVAPPSGAPDNGANPLIHRPMMVLAIAAIVALPQAALAWLESAERLPGEVGLQLPVLAAWSNEEDHMQWRPAYENPNATARRAYGRDGSTVGVHVSYYRNQDYGRKLVTSTNELVKSSDPRWLRVASGMLTPRGEGPVRSVRTVVLRGSNGERLMVWHWYWINGHITTSDAAAKLLTAVERLRGRGDDSAAVFVYAVLGESDGDAVLHAFLADAAPAVIAALEAAKGSASGDRK